MEVGFQCGDEEGERAAGLLTAGLHDGKQCLDEAAARGALRAEAEFAPDDRMSQSSFTCVVRGLDLFVAARLFDPSCPARLEIPPVPANSITTVDAVA